MLSREKAASVDSTICPFISGSFIYLSVFSIVHQCVFDCDGGGGGDGGAFANGDEENSYHFAYCGKCFS